MKEGVLFRSARHFASSAHTLKHVICDRLNIRSVIDLRQVFLSRQPTNSATDTCFQPLRHCVSFFYFSVLRDDDLSPSRSEFFSRTLLMRLFGLQMPVRMSRKTQYAFRELERLCHEMGEIEKRGSQMGQQHEPFLQHSFSTWSHSMQTPNRVKEDSQTEYIQDRAVRRTVAKPNASKVMTRCEFNMQKEHVTLKVQQESSEPHKAQRSQLSLEQQVGCNANVRGA